MSDWNMAQGFIAAIAVELTMRGYEKSAQTLTNVASITMDGGYILAEYWEDYLGLDGTEIY